jgi:hypothetical protein
VSAYSVEGWGEFAVASVGAGAVLAGLIFISVSITLEKILSVPGLPGRAGESLVMFLGAMVLGLFVLVPQSERAFAIEILVGGILLAALLVLVAVTGARSPGRQPLAWRVTRVVTALAAALPAPVAGVSLLLEEGGGLYWLVASFVISFLVGSANAWVLLVEVVRDERYKP